MQSSITFAPMIPWNALWLMASFATLCTLFGLWRGLPGWGYRALALLVLLSALAGPSLQKEQREGLSNIVLVVIDRSESQTVSVRPEQITKAVGRLVKDIGGLENFEIKTVEVTNDLSLRDDGTHLIAALHRAAGKVSADRLAGAVLVTDGQVDDATLRKNFPAPVHVLLTGRKDDWDRRLVIKNAPAFAIMDETIMLSLRIEDQGQVPLSVQGQARISIAIDDGKAQEFNVETNTDLELPLTLSHAGVNILQFNVIPVEGELTERNNSAVVSINGVRDRLRVLLVSGEPYAGERTWRNLLKSDSAVDLVHFTILRPPEKQDGVPVRELSLIAFPTRELFLEKVNQFDLIIFDRYSKRGLLPDRYLSSVVDYARNGGAVLIASGPDFAGVNSIYRTPLARILPAKPTARVYEQGYLPTITDIGKRHPVTEGLEAFSPKIAADRTAPWGRWFRQIDADQKSGTAVMSGINGRPLLLLDRAGKGRIAMLLSDQAWLWSRGFEGGGPQLELLRRLAHWMMKEPDLEEERLTVTAIGQTVTILRRSLELGNKKVTIETPEGAKIHPDMTEVKPGLWQGTYKAGKNGLYHLTDGLLSSVFALGPTAPKEFENTIANADKLRPLVKATKGVVLAISDVPRPKIRLVRAGHTAGGKNWIGLTPRGAYITTDIASKPLFPAWLLLLLTALLTICAWRRESR
ncbi:MAG: hypothetical protein QM492_01650 [Rhodobacterales bacterium]